MTDIPNSQITSKEFFDVLIKIVKSYRPELVLKSYADYPICLKMEFRDD